MLYIFAVLFIKIIKVWVYTSKQTSKYSSSSESEEQEKTNHLDDIEEAIEDLATLPVPEDRLRFEPGSDEFFVYRFASGYCLIL